MSTINKGLLDCTREWSKLIKCASIFSAAIPPAEEPEKIRKWREDQKAMLEQKDVEEEKKREELKVQAKKELEDWYKQHEETITKTKSSNR